MNNELKPYDEYKKVDSVWKDYIPKHWDFTRIKNVIRYSVNGMWGDEPKNEDENNVICIRVADFDMKRFKVKTNNLTVRNIKLDKNDRRWLEKGDLLIEKSGGGDKQPVGRVIIFNNNFPSICSNFISKIRVNDDVINSKYLMYYFNTLYEQRQILPHINQTTGIQNLNDKSYFNSLVLLPTKDEQNQIVRYLDSKLSKINKFIKSKKYLIEVLKEQKQVAVNEAFTKGLDPKAKMKPSGIDWLGEIPEYWDVRRCKFLFSEVDERSEHGKETHLSMSQKYGLVPNEVLDERHLISENYIGAKVCKKDDLVLNRLKAHLGVFALSPQLGLVSPDYTVLRPNQYIYPKFAEHVLKSQACRGELCKRVKGIVVGFWRLYTDDFYNIVLPLPSYQEQKNIVEYIDGKFELIDNIINKTEQEIDIITEYRTRLISDVVSGKVDVRGIVVEDIVEQDTDIYEIDQEVIDGEEVEDFEECEV